MATAIATKPAPPHQKMKRPPPPLVQTSVNGTRSSQSSPSPSLSSKRPPPGFKLPQSATTINGVNGGVNGVGPRSSNRRKDSQKPGDIPARQNRSGKSAQVDGHIERRPLKKMFEPYVKTQSYILKKYPKAPPSLTVHLHPTHFRFDQQDGSFSYNSPMKVILEHIKAQTVPHDMVDELFHAGVKFYEGCLITQILDHRTTSLSTQPSTTSSASDKKIPFSVHNYNEHLIPSPYVPYPRPSHSDAGSGDTNHEPSSIEPSTKHDANASTHGKEPSSKKTSKGPKKFTVVLFPTPLTIQEEVFVYANTPDPRANSRKQSQSSSTNSLNRTPASAIMAHPSTPLSAVPPTPSATGPPNKKQKMMVGEKEIRLFESKAITTTAPPLYLEPVDNIEEAQRLRLSLTDPLHQQGFPAPKTRKRTVAELAADEALAAQEQRFMLIMDERLAPSASAIAGTKSNTTDGEAGAASFEPRFERFKTLEAIKADHALKAQRDQEAKAHLQAQQAAAKAKQEQLDRDLRQAQEQKVKENSARELQLRQHQAATARYVAQNQANALQQQPVMEARPNHVNVTVPSGVMPNGQQHMVATSQAHHSSPIVRNMTPHSNSSPLVGNMMVSHPGQSIPMSITSSGQGNTSSPARPSSALQHAHPGGGAAMVHNRSQHPISRRGTPQMPNGTPSMQHVTPVMNHSTPTSRMGHASPPNPMAQTPVMGQSAIAAQHLMGQHVTPHQHQQLMHHRAYVQQQQQHQQQQQQRLQNQSPNNQMSPERTPASMANLQQLAAQNQHRNYETYQQQLLNHHQQMNGHIPNGTPPQHHGQPHLQQQQQQHHPPQPGQQRPHPSAQQYLQQAHQKAYHSLVAKLQVQYGNNIPPEDLQNAKHRAVAMAQNYMNAQRNIVVQKQQQQQQMEAQHIAAQQAALMTQMNQMGGQGGINGMGGMQ